MNSISSQISDTHRLVLILSDRINLKITYICDALPNIIMYYT